MVFRAGTRWSLGSLPSQTILILLLMLSNGAAAQAITSIGAGGFLHTVAHVGLASASPLLLLQHAAIKLFLFSAV